MKKTVKILIWSAIMLCILNSVWLGYSSYQYFFVSEGFEAQEINLILIFIGLILLFFSHIIINLSIIISLKKQSGMFLPGIILLIIGSLSFIMIFFHWGALTDILKEYPAGLEINNELKAIRISQILHILFIISSLIYLNIVIKIPQPNKTLVGLINEQLFVSMNIIGIVCGIVGLLIVTADFFFRVNPQSYKWAIIPYSLMVFLPYLLLLTVWFFKTFSDKKSGWSDEKLKFDIYKSSTFTLICSIPLMILLFLLNYNNINGIVTILWLPFYLFVVLTVFSISVLYNFKSN